MSVPDSVVDEFTKSEIRIRPKPPSACAHEGPSLEQIVGMSPTCRFAKRGCVHDDELFKPAYQRVNRARGTKILRCFPHCCPAHIPRSYCGATIELHVDSMTTELVVYARFRLRDEPPALRVGECIALAALTKELQSPANTKAPWIQSRLRGNDEENVKTTIFEINPGRRWYYPWDSSKNSATRATKHVLEAFVFKSDGHTLECMGIVTSPSFTLVSFRRVSASETALIAEELKEQSTSVHSPTLKREPLRQSLRVLIKDKHSKDSVPRRHRSQSSTVTESLEPLAVLLNVVQQHPIGEVTHFLPIWMSMQTETVTQIPSGLFQDHIHVAIHVVWWLLIDRATQSAWDAHTQRGAHVLLDREALRTCYKRWMRWLTSHIECYLATLEQPSLPELAAALMTRGYMDQHLHKFSWSSFVAQARELFTGLARPDPATIRRLHASNLWVCPLERVTVVSLENTTSLKLSTGLDSFRSVPVATLFGFWHQFSRIHIDLNTSSSPPQLIIATAHSVKHTSCVMRMLLDNRYRSCHAWPHGDATSGSILVGFTGDYLAATRRDGTIEVSLFSWPTQSNQSASRWFWKFHPRDLLTAKQLEMDLVVSTAELYHPFHGDSTTWSIQNKLANIRQWHVTHKAQLSYTTTAQVN